MVVARFAGANGAYSADAVCYAPHLIDYTARAVAVRPNGSIVIAGYARDRHAAVAAAGHAGRHVRPARRRNAARLRATAWHCDELRHVLRPPAASRSARTASRSTALGYDGTVTNAALAGRYYDAVVGARRQPLRRRHDERPRRRRLGAALHGAGRRARHDASPAAASPFRRDVPARARPCLATDRCWQPASRSTPRCPPTGRCASPRSADGRAGGLRNRRHRSFARGRRQQHRPGHRGPGRRQHPRRRLGQPRRQDARSPSRASRAAGVRDDTFGNHGETTTPFGTPAINGYITGIAPERQPARRRRAG